MTVTSKSNNKGTNLFEYPNFDATLGGTFSEAVRIGSMRGNWERTGGNTFDYTFMGFAYDMFNMPVYIAKISGEVELIENCRYQKTTAIMAIFLPNMGRSRSKMSLTRKWCCRWARSTAIARRLVLLLLFPSNNQRTNSPRLRPGPLPRAHHALF